MLGRTLGVTKLRWAGGRVTHHLTVCVGVQAGRSSVEDGGKGRLLGIS